MNRIRLLFACIITAMIFISCCRIPQGVKPVAPFEVEKYMGRWYEIARLDHRFERGLTNVTAEYTLNENGFIRVVNRGYNSSENKWATVEGRAKLASSRNEASLKVSFFGPFYAPYKVVLLDSNYRYAMVVSCGTRYLWILSREKTVPDSIKQQFLITAENSGFKVSSLIWVEHNQ